MAIDSGVSVNFCLGEVQAPSVAAMTTSRPRATVRATVRGMIFSEDMPDKNEVLGPWCKPKRPVFP